jgi:hypothetical protein
MEGPGIITDLMDKSTTDRHPGTMNFPYRLANARRIHQENLAMASRLDSIKAYYDSKTLAAMTKQQQKLSPKKLKLTSRLDKSTNENSTNHGRVVLGKNALHINQSATYNSSYSPDPYSTSMSGGNESAGGNRSKRGRNVLLEYTKIQKGRVLDVAVIKEPFRDNYCIFGIDIDNGQRYELKLSSEEVSNILEGDILVTSVDNVEVWMTLLTKVELYPVEAFAKIPLPSQPQRAFSSSNQYGRGRRGDGTSADAPEFHEDGDHENQTFSSIHLEDETLNPQLHCQKSSTPVVRLPTKPTAAASAVTESEFPPLDDQDHGGSHGSFDTAVTNHHSTERVHENDSASILTAGDSDDNRYTLDEYYDSNIHLTPLPLSESTNAIKQQEGEGEGEGGVAAVEVKDPYYDPMDAGILTQTRPSARGTSRGVHQEEQPQQQQQPSRPQSSQGQPTHSSRVDEHMRQPQQQQQPPQPQQQDSTKIVSQLAELTMKTIMSSVLEELRQKKIQKMTTKENENKRTTETEKHTTLKPKKQNSKELLNPSAPERKRSVAAGAGAARASQTDPKKRMSVPNVANSSGSSTKSNPYRSSKVSTAGRSHSIRYTTEEAAQHAITSAAPPAAAPPLQPVPPSDTPAPSTKQQSTIRKQSVRKQSSISSTDAKASSSAASAAVPSKPQESMPSARRPSKQTTTTTVAATATGAKNSNEGTNRKMSKISAPPVAVAVVKEETESRGSSVEDCHALAQSMAASVIELAELNIQKLVQQIAK